MKDNSTTPPVVNEISQLITSHFGDNLVSLLLYGSSQHHLHFWDLDLMVILRPHEKRQDDFLFLRSVTSRFSDYDLDLQVIYTNEIISADSFSLDAHGAFFSRVLAQALVLHGENPFARLTPSEEAVTRSLVNRIQRYVFQARQECVGNGRFVRNKNPSYHQKHVKRALLDFVLMHTSCESVDQAEQWFKNHFPGAFAPSDWNLLSSPSDDITEYIALYEKVYKLALQSCKLFLPPETSRPLRSSLDEIAFEYVLPPEYTEAIIVLDGLPRTPELTSFLQVLASWGYAAFFPRLKGTWESGGEFLTHNPADDIRLFATRLKQGVVLQGRSVRADRVTVLGTSFGGLVALGASVSADVSLVIAFSPVYAMSKVTEIETLEPFLEKAFPGAYRYEKHDWERLCRDEILSFDAIARTRSFDPSKCCIVAGEKDEQVDIRGLRALCERAGMALQTLSLGHLSFHKNIRELRPLLYDLLNSKNRI